MLFFSKDVWRDFFFFFPFPGMWWSPTWWPQSWPQTGGGSEAKQGVKGPNQDEAALPLWIQKPMGEKKALQLWRTLRRDKDGTSVWSSRLSLEGLMALTRRGNFVLKRIRVASGNSLEDLRSSLKNRGSDAWPLPWKSNGHWPTPSGQLIHTACPKKTVFKSTTAKDGSAKSRVLPSQRSLVNVYPIKPLSPPTDYHSLLCIRDRICHPSWCRGHNQQTAV